MSTLLSFTAQLMGDRSHLPLHRSNESLPGSFGKVARRLWRASPPARDGTPAPRPNPSGCRYTLKPLL
ncbi:MAG: hypothetical protein HC865_03365 [Cyanobacteria bacterium RU_5_0]|nr:hypothetical protein [Cyanobacteria bacterium RU_5_0]